MIPIEFEKQNSVFTKPEGWTDDQCSPLPSFKGMQNEMPVIVSCWKLTQDELDLILKTGKVWLTVLGNTQPPVLLSVDHELDK